MSKLFRDLIETITKGGNKLDYDYAVTVDCGFTANVSYNYSNPNVIDIGNSNFILFQLEDNSFTEYLINLIQDILKDNPNATDMYDVITYLKKHNNSNDKVYFKFITIFFDDVDNNDLYEEFDTFDFKTNELFMALIALVKEYNKGAN